MLRNHAAERESLCLKICCCQIDMFKKEKEKIISDIEPFLIERQSRARFSQRTIQINMILLHYYAHHYVCHLSSQQSPQNLIHN